MSKTLDNFEFREPPKYPWKRWMNGNIHQAFEGKDFKCKCTSFVATLHKHAEVACKKVVTKKKGDSVVFQFS